MTGWPVCLGCRLGCRRLRSLLRLRLAVACGWRRRRLPEAPLLRQRRPRSPAAQEFDDLVRGPRHEHERDDAEQCEVRDVAKAPHDKGRRAPLQSLHELGWLLRLSRRRCAGGCRCGCRARRIALGLGRHYRPATGVCCDTTAQKRCLELKAFSRLVFSRGFRSRGATLCDRPEPGGCYVCMCVCGGERFWRAGGGGCATGE